MLLSEGPDRFLDTVRIYSHPPMMETKNDLSHSCTQKERAARGDRSEQGYKEDFKDRQWERREIYSRLFNCGRGSLPPVISRGALWLVQANEMWTKVTSVNSRSRYVRARMASLHPLFTFSRDWKPHIEMGGGSLNHAWRKSPDSHDMSHELKTNYWYVKPLRFQSSGVTMAEPNILILRQHGRPETRKRTK